MPYYRMFGTESREIDVWTNYAGKDNIVITHVTSAELPTLGAPGEVETYALRDGIEPLAWNPETNAWENFYTVLGIPVNTGPAGPAGTNGADGTNGTNGMDARRIDNYTGTTDVDGLFTVVYPTEFPNTPTVLLEPTTSAQGWEKVSSDETGFTFKLQEAGNPVASVEVKAVVL